MTNRKIDIRPLIKITEDPRDGSICNVLAAAECAAEFREFVLRNGIQCSPLKEAVFADTGTVTDYNFQAMSAPAPLDEVFGEWSKLKECD